MRILITLTYYRPHYSGLTIYTERLARALAARGHQVTVITSRYDPSLPAHEIKDGVEIIRPWVLMRLSKGVIMPDMIWHVAKKLREADVVSLHVPQLDAALDAVLARLMGKPVVLTYHCDLRLPKGFIHGLANQASHVANHISAIAANVIVTNTQDYADNSPFLKNYLGKVQVIPPPSELAAFTPADVEAFRQKFAIDGQQKIIGMVARLATEKGVEYLVYALPGVKAALPNTRAMFVGQYQDVLGEEKYAARLEPLIRDLGKDHWSFLGVLSPVELAVFYHLSSVIVLPSLNGTESFGMVQIESMSSGTPVIASNLPGVRQPVLSTGMGKIIPPRDAGALETALVDVLEHRDRFGGDSQAIAQRYAPDTIAAEYEEIFKKLVCKI
jgi:glycosyltransferase involved in cell wall biosynthesis